MGRLRCRGRGRSELTEALCRGARGVGLWRSVGGCTRLEGAWSRGWRIRMDSQLRQTVIVFLRLSLHASRTKGTTAFHVVCLIIDSREVVGAYVRVSEPGQRDDRVGAREVSRTFNPQYSPACGKFSRHSQRIGPRVSSRPASLFEIPLPIRHTFMTYSSLGPPSPPSETADVYKPLWTLGTPSTRHFAQLCTCWRHLLAIERRLRLDRQGPCRS